MRRIVLLVATISLCTMPRAQESGSGDAAGSDYRKSRILELVSTGRGEVTALEPSNSGDGSVAVGYASGTLAICHPVNGCRELSGTPGVPVERIAISPEGTSEVIWASYRQGALYRCANYQCEKQLPGDATGVGAPRTPSRP